MPENANGVLYALAGFSGGITCYVKDGFLCYEFNLFEIQRTKLKSNDKLPTGEVKIEVESKLAAKIGGPMDVTLKVNGKDVAQGRVPAAMSLHFTSNATFDWVRPGFARVARLLRPGPVRLQRHHRHDKDFVSQEIETRYENQTHPCCRLVWLSRAARAGCFARRRLRAAVPADTLGQRRRPDGPGVQDGVAVGTESPQTRHTKHPDHPDR